MCYHIESIISSVQKKLLGLIMSTVNTLHKISYLKWPFLLAEVVLIPYAFTISSQSEKLIATIATIILVTGIHLGLESLSDVRKMSKKQILNYQKRKNIETQTKTLLFAILFLAIISLLFFALKFFGSQRNEALYNEFFNLGLNLWALILGLLCLLKSLQDKYLYAQSNKCNFL